jgi:nicotinamidase-related amidase
MPTPRLICEYTALLVVDVQEKLAAVMSDRARLERQVALLVEACGRLDVPVLATEQYPRGLGSTVAAVADKWPPGLVRAEKMKFSAFIEQVRGALARRGATTVLVCGIEAHVCVQQTCLDLLDAGYTAAVAVDAIDSRRAADRQAAVQRMVQAGVLPVTAESALLEMVREAGGERFKAVLPLIR